MILSTSFSVSLQSNIYVASIKIIFQMPYAGKRILCNSTSSNNTLHENDEYLTNNQKKKTEMLLLAARKNVIIH